MDIIRTGLDISRTIRNVGRLREIVLVFAKNGFDEFISSGVTSKIPNFVLPRSKKRLKDELIEQADRDWSQIIGGRLRKCFEELGPLFIKFGQLLSSREDIFEPSFIDEMKLLRDRVKGVPFSIVKDTMEKSLEGPCESFFSSIEELPIGTASIGVVHKGVLLDGTEVVIKIRRPEIKKIVETDFSLLSFIIEQVERISEEIKFLGLSRMIHDFGVRIQHELNFNFEALNCERFKKNISKHDKDNVLYIPKVFKNLTKEDILVTEYLDGIPFSDTFKIRKNLKDLSPKLHKGVRIFLKTFLEDGFFHADLHGGNFFLLENGQVGIVDFGLMGSLGRKNRQNFIAIIYSLLTFNYENLVYEFLDVAEYEVAPDVDSLISDVRNVLSPFVGLTVDQINCSQILHTVISTLGQHQVFLPRDWFVVFRAFMTLDGVGKSLGLDFDLYAILDKDIQAILKNSLNKQELLEEAIWIGRDVLSFFRMFPRHLRWYIKDWSKQGHAFEVVNKGYEEQLNGVANSIVFMGLMIVSSMFIISSVILLGNYHIENFHDIPILCWIFWGMAALIILRGVFLIRKK